jgi:outer membrane biosynthesis protein TonB
MWAAALGALLLAFCAGLLVHQRLLIPLRDANQPYETPPAETAQDTNAAQTAAPGATGSQGAINQPAMNRGRASRAPSGARAGSALINRPEGNETSSPDSTGVSGNAIPDAKYPEATVEREPRAGSERNLQPRYMAPAMIGASAGLMASHLIYAPPPEYPGIARMTHVQGRVLVEAVVGKNGQVIRAEAISGHRLLRGAAVHEVYERRYRPYLLNDRPTDVATIVAVEFRLR